MVRGSQLKPYCPSKEGGGVGEYKKIVLLVFFQKSDKNLSKKIYYLSYSYYIISFWTTRIPIWNFVQFPTFCRMEFLGGIDMGIEKVRLYNCVQGKETANLEAKE